MFLLIQQFRIQFQRNLTLFMSDRINLFLAFAQAPLIAALMVLTFYGNWRDCEKKDLMARTFNRYTTQTQGKKSISINDLSKKIIRSYKQALNEDISTQVFSEAMAQNRSVIYFVLVAASIWMGILGSCKEIVSEWEVIHRDSHSRISTFSYIASKSVLLCTVAGIQTCLLTYLSLPYLIPGSLGHSLDIWLILWLTASCAVETGLLVSCLSSSLQMALTCVPILMIPQLLLGGFLRPPARGEANSMQDYAAPMRNYAAMLTIQRWAFEACVAVESREKVKYLNFSEFLKAFIDRCVAVENREKDKNPGQNKDYSPKPKIIEIFFEPNSPPLDSASNNEKLVWVWRVIECRDYAMDNYFFVGPEQHEHAWEIHFLRPVKVMLYALLGLFCSLAVVLKLRIMLTNVGGRGVFFILRKSGR